MRLPVCPAQTGIFGFILKIKVCEVQTRPPLSCRAEGNYFDIYFAQLRSKWKTEFDCPSLSLSEFLSIKGNIRYLKYRDKPSFFTLWFVLRTSVHVFVEINFLVLQLKSNKQFHLSTLIKQGRAFSQSRFCKLISQSQSQFLRISSSGHYFFFDDILRLEQFRDCSAQQLHNAVHGDEKLRFSARGSKVRLKPAERNVSRRSIDSFDSEVLDWIFDWILDHSMIDGLVFKWIFE